MLTSELPRTYTGLLDDAFIRYAGNYATEAFFNKMIAKSVFFGGYLYINDGYLINHPLARRYLQNDDSLLREMLYAGFVRILTRTQKVDDLVALPEIMGESDNRTFKEFLHSDEWPRFRPTWELLADYVYDTNQVERWPRYDMTQGFVKLLTPVWKSSVASLGFRSVTDGELTDLRSEFDKSSPTQGNARDKFEKAAAKKFGFSLSQPQNASLESQHKMAEVMRVANEVYHNNFGMMMTLRDGDRAVAVDTTLSASSDNIHQTDQIFRGQLDNIELLRLPENIPFEDGSWFHPFLNHTHQVGQAKLQYISSLTDIVRAVTNGLSQEQIIAKKKEVNEATRQYFARVREKLIKRFGQTYADEALQEEEAITVTVGAHGTKDESGRPVFFAGADGGVIATLRDASADHGIDFILNKLENVEDAKDRFQPDERSITFGDMRPQLASLAFNRKWAEQHAQGIKQFGKKPSFMDYFGKIKTVFGKRKR